MRDIRDGFELAERDWELRREGNVLGLVQSGLPELRVASLQREGHRELAVRAREVAEALLDADGRLRPGHAALEAELRTGWLGGVARAEPGPPRERRGAGPRARVARWPSARARRPCRRGAGGRRPGHRGIRARDPHRGPRRGDPAPRPTG